MRWVVQWTRRWLDRVRREPNPVFRSMVILAAVLIGLSACALTVAAAVFAFDRGWSQFGPGGVFSQLRPGQPAPDFELPTPDGRPVSLRDFRGRPVVVNFWATWCVPCVVEVPLLDAAQRDHADKGLVVLGVNAGERADVVVRFIDRHDLKYEVLLDAGSWVARRYGVIDWPTTLWIDGDGVLRAADYGRIDADRIAERVADLLAAPAPPAR